MFFNVNFSGWPTALFEPKLIDRLLDIICKDHDE